MKKALFLISLTLIACSPKQEPEYTYPEGTDICVVNVNTFTRYTLLEDITDDRLYVKAHSEQDTTFVDTRLIVKLYHCKEASTDGK